MLKHDRTEWERATEGPRYLKGRTYRDLVQFTRPCATCGEPFSILVTRKIADGHADANNFGLKNCELHRRGKSAKPDVYAIERELRTEIEKLLAENAALKNKSQKMPWEA